MLTLNMPGIDDNGLPSEAVDVKKIISEMGVWCVYSFSRLCSERFCRI